MSDLKNILELITGFLSHLDGCGIETNKCDCGLNEIRAAVDCLPETGAD